MILTDVEAAADAILARIGTHVALAVPLGLGKPVPLADHFDLIGGTGLPALASSTASIRLRKATEIAPRTPPPLSARMRLGPGPNRWRSRELVGSGW